MKSLPTARCAFAKDRESDQASLLNETLEEEKETDEKLTDLSREINTKAIKERSQRRRGAGETEQVGKCRNALRS